RLDPFPVWRYRTASMAVEKSVFLRQGEQTAVILYRSTRKCRLRVSPFLAFRDYHSLQHATDAFHRDVLPTANTVEMRPFDGLPALRIHHNSAGFVPVGNWYYHNEYRTEMERGLDFREDLYRPGWFDFELEAGETAYLVATISGAPAPDVSTVKRWEADERERRAAILAAAPEEGSLIELRQRLEEAAEQFLVTRADGSPTVIAGYPWFTDWGRDTMITLPGLLITRGRVVEAEQILSGFLAHLDQGLIPNRFPDAGEKPEYNTVDATLWMFSAAWALESEGRSEPFLRDVFYPAAKEIIAWHRKGTHYGIAVDPEDGLLKAGSPGVQLTWMDAKVGGWVVTPRDGKPVEINALWYNSL